MSEDTVPFEIMYDFPQTGDLSGQSGNDVIDAFPKVRFTIENVTPKVNVDKVTGVKKTASLSVRCSIGTLGVDGEGKYKNKNLFQDLTSWVNTEVLTSDWWKKNAQFPYKSFLKALGYDIANPPKINNEYITSLKGREFIADIKKSPVKIKVDGVYQPTGEFKNELTNFKSVEA